MNIIDLLKERERGQVQMQQSVENALEDSFISGNAEQFDNSMPRSVSSTIAIAMASDGLTFATTHGDHTVKVFDFRSGTQIRNFSGHPRTPWTLKYHPMDSNIIASGCLGFQVRVWDIKDNVCLNVIVYSQTIISLAFHPHGEFLAIACGMRIELWEWQIHEETEGFISQETDTPIVTASKYLKTLEQQEAEGLPYYCRSITHKRNIRAVLFHPSGDYIFAVAPDSPKQNNEDLAHCRLYACEFDALFELDRTLHWGECFDVASSLSDSTSPVDTTGTTTSTTTTAAVRNTNSTERATRSNTHSSSLSHNELPSTRDHTRTTPTTTTTTHSTTTTTHSMSYEVDRDDGEGGEIPEDDDMYILPIKLTSCRVLIPQIHLYSDGGIDISKDGRFLLTCARVHIPPILTEYQAAACVQPPNTSNFSPNSHPARVVAADRETSWITTTLPFRSREGMRGGGGSSGNIPSFMPPTAPAAAPVAPPLFLAHNIRQLSGIKEASSFRTSSSTPIVTASSSSSSPLHTLPSPPGRLNRYSSGTNSSTNENQNNHNSDPLVTPIRNTGSNQHLPELIADLSIQDTRTIDGVPIVIDMTRRSRPRPTSTASNTLPVQNDDERVCTLLMSKEKLLNAIASSSSSSGDSSGESTSQHTGSTSSMGPRRARAVIAEVADRRIHTHWKQKMMRMGDRPPSGWAQEDHLCVFQLNFLPTGAVLSPTLVNSKCLPGSLTKAVTSTRLSATGRYALIGYGVRVGGQVQDHLRRHAACEIVSVNCEDMRSVAVMSDFEDEVNIAQFHPHPGYGIVYGTKRGKVRTFTKS